MHKKNLIAAPPLHRKRVLITGASGFIGSFLVERALEKGLDVWAAVRPTSSRRYLKDPRIHFLEADLSSDERLTMQLATYAKGQVPFDYVIHAAGATRAKNEAAFRRVNTEGTLRLARLLMATGALKPAGRFVFISSLSVCGCLHDTDRRPLRATDVPSPNTAYGRSKLDAERGLARIEGLNYVILRPTGVYGPREKDYFLMAKSIRRHVDFAVGYSPQVLTFIYVRDLVEAAMLALRGGRLGHVYHLSDGHQYTSRSFSDLLALHLGVRHVLHIVAPLWVLKLACWCAEKGAALASTTSTLNTDKYRIMKQRNWRCDIAPAREELGYTPRWPLARGVQEAVAWYKQEGWL